MRTKQDRIKKDLQSYLIENGWSKDIAKDISEYYEKCNMDGVALYAETLNDEQHDYWKEIVILVNKWMEKREEKRKDIIQNYEEMYQLHKEMFKRIWNGNKMKFDHPDMSGTFNLNYSTELNKYCLIRAAMDISGVNHVIKIMLDEKWNTSFRGAVCKAWFYKNFDGKTPRLTVSDEIMAGIEAY